MMDISMSDGSVVSCRCKTRAQKRQNCRKTGWNYPCVVVNPMALIRIGWISLGSLWVVERVIMQANLPGWLLGCAPAPLGLRLLLQQAGLVACGLLLFFSTPRLGLRLPDRQQGMPRHGPRGLGMQPTDPRLFARQLQLQRQRGLLSDGHVVIIRQ